MPPLQYGAPWGAIYRMWPSIASGSRYSVDVFSREVVSRMQPPPRSEGMENIPADPGFLICANHYQRKGMWILHPASAITQSIRAKRGPSEAPVRWVVTANWPKWRLGSWQVPNPGDWLLPRVAHALHCYPVSFAGANPAYTARSLRRLLQDARSLNAPIGLFPEGVGGAAGRIGEALPGVERLIQMLARQGVRVLPVGIREENRLVIRFGTMIEPGLLAEAGDAARLVMGRIADLAQR
ncbi:MAG: hypothetical protein JST93_21190 [Acidobacteria bacterium]|nr:hypothetical protein [Acidobacteriota bacterium]